MRDIVRPRLAARAAAATTRRSNSRPATAAICRRLRQAGERRSRRAAITSCTPSGIADAGASALCTQLPSGASRRTSSLTKNGLPSVRWWTRRDHGARRRGPRRRPSMKRATSASERPPQRDDPAHRLARQLAERVEQRMAAVDLDVAVGADQQQRLRRRSRGPGTATAAGRAGRRGADRRGSAPAAGGAPRSSGTWSGCRRSESGPARRRAAGCAGRSGSRWRSSSITCAMSAAPRPMSASRVAGSLARAYARSSCDPRPVRRRTFALVAAADAAPAHRAVARAGPAPRPCASCRCPARRRAA